MSGPKPCCQNVPCPSQHQVHVHICYLPGGMSVWEKTVPKVLSTQDQGHSFFPIRIDLAFVFLLLKVGKPIYRRHLVQSFFLWIVKIRFHCVRSHQNLFSLIVIFR